jgi:hypothetical protein
MILGTYQNWFHNFWTSTYLDIEFTSLVYELNLEIAKKGKGPATTKRPNDPGPA